MRSHGRNNRKPRSVKEQEDDILSHSRMDDTSDSYPRSHHYPHRTETYRDSPVVRRTSYETNREPSSSRGRRDDDWHQSSAVQERGFGDVYHRSERQDYGPSRDTDLWHVDNTIQYSQPREDWPRYDHGSSSTSYSEHWGATTVESDRGSYYDPWLSRDIRPTPQDARAELRQGDKLVERGVSWQRDPRRPEGNSARFQSDAGWDTRRKGKAWEEPSTWEEAPPYDRREDRSWEPAVTWKNSDHDDDTDSLRRRRRLVTHPTIQARPSKAVKRQSINTKQKRDWRSDDGHLNNWTRRDSHNLTKKPTASMTNRKHRRSSSRSRSRSHSPAESSHSRPSTRGRSRSLSFSPASKRRRRDGSPAVVPAHELSGRGDSNWVLPHRADKEYSRSRSPYRSPNSFPSPNSYPSPNSFPVRRRSISSTSSLSSRRSISQSPPGRTRAVHRLPLANNVIATPSKTSKTAGSGSRRNGKHPSNGKYNQADKRSYTTQGPTEGLKSDPMPPPTIIPVSHHSRATYQNQNNTALLPSQEHSRTRITPNKVVPFKPIPNTNINSAIKMFFPGDEDEMESTLERSLSSAASDRVPTVNSNLQSPRHQDVHWVQSQYRDRETGARQDVKPQIPSKVSVSPKAKMSSPSAEAFTVPNELVTRRSQGGRTPVFNEPLRISPPEPIEEDGLNTPVISTFSLPVRKELYNIISQVGEGTFGKVYKARNTVTNVHVALKRIRMESEKDGFPVTAMREIKLLQSLRHDNVVRLYEMMVSNGSVYMVFEYMDHDLTGILSQTQFNFTEAHLKSLCHQMLAGLAYLHHKGVIHRDIKGSNILINHKGELKLADFGLARFYQKRRRTDYTNRVITLWYRPPELLFGATVYGPEVDMWSAGCIMLELFTKKPVFQGNDEIHQLDVVYKIIGTPTPERWNGVVNLPWYELVKPREVIPNHFRELFQKWMSPASLDLAEQLLAYDPAQRITAVQAMNTPYFTQEQPQAEAPVGLATLEGEWHELETKRERAKKRRRNESVP